MITLQPRQDVSWQLTMAVPIAAVIATLVLGGIIFALMGYDPVSTLYEFFVKPLSRSSQIGNLLVKACPLILIATGLIFCFRANVWNIGAEGQLIFGAIGAGGVALAFPEVASKWLLVPMAVAAMLCGALWALIPAVLKVRLKTNEILVSLMLSYVASLFIDWLVRGPWRDPASFGFPLTPRFPDGGLIPTLILPVIGRLGQLHWGVMGAVFIAVLGWFVMRRTLFGYQVRVLGDAPRAGAFAGFNASATTIAVMCVSGGLAGLAGMVEVSANIGQLQPNISFGYGFTAIIVAFLARLNPLSVIIAGLVIALAELGGDAAQISIGVPKVVTGVVKGILLFLLLSGETLTRYHVTFNFSGTLSVLRRTSQGQGRADHG